MNNNANRKIPLRIDSILPQIKIDSLADNLFSDIALEVAEDISGNNKKNTSTQLRRFYDELVLWHGKIGNDPKKYKQSAPFIQMIRAKVAYARSRDYVDDNFKAMMDTLIKQIKSPETLENAKMFFEAMIGFKKAIEQTKGTGKGE